MKIKPLLFFSIVFFIVVFLLMSYRLVDSFNYDTDFANDLYVLTDISRGHFTLLGPKSSFGGVYSLPYYYYLFTPVFFLSNLNLSAVLLFNVFLFSAASAYFFWITARKYGFTQAILSSLSLVLMPFFLFIGRNPSNANSYISLLLIFLTYIMFKKYDNIITLFVLGFFCAVVLTFNYAAFLLFIPILFFVYFFLKKKRNILFFIVGFGIAFAPLIFFELRHNFIMFTNTFFRQSYKLFTEDKNISSGLSENKNIFNNFFFLSQKIGIVTAVPSIISFVIGAVIIRFYRIKFNREVLLFILSFISFLTLVLVLRFQYANHYIYPVAFFITFSLIVLILKSKANILLFIIIFIEILSLPKYLYSNSNRPVNRFEETVNYVINNNLIKKSDSFSVLQIRPDTIIAPSGFEYRFFFNKKGFTPNTVFEFNKSRTLFIFSEVPDFQIEKLNNWEINQFGKEYLKKAQIYQIGKLKLYKIVKI